MLYCKILVLCYQDRTSKAGLYFKIVDALTPGPSSDSFSVKSVRSKMAELHYKNSVKSFSVIWSFSRKKLECTHRPTINAQKRLQGNKLLYQAKI